MTSSLQKAYQQVYGLSGIMGSGKSSAAKIFEQLGAKIISADALNKEVASPQYFDHKKIRQQIEQLDKQPLYRDDGQLDSRKLALLVFPHPQKLKKLTNIVHPHIAALFEKKMQKFDAHETIIYDVPLLYETDIHKFTKANIVVYAPESVCIKRAMQRTGLSQTEIKNRLKRQISIEEKQKRADYLIVNDTDFAQLETEVKKVWKKINT